MIKIYKKALISILLLGAFAMRVHSQDVHFSQFDAAPTYFNPALAGLIDCNNRIIGNFKTQWATYNSAMLSYDQKLSRLATARSQFGLGGFVNADYSGALSYGNVLGELTPAYHFEAIPSKLTLSVGLAAMFNYNSFNEANAVSGSHIDPITGETIYGGSDMENTSQFYWDLGAGVNAKYMVNENFPVNLGFAMKRLLENGGGLQDNSVSNYRRFSVNSNAVVPVNTIMSFLPSLIYIQQHRYNQLNFGTYFKYNLAHVTHIIEAAYVGVWYRWDDAVIFGLSADKLLGNDWLLNFGINYDLTVSDFRSSNKWTSGQNVRSDSFEISIRLMNCKSPIRVVRQGIINDPFR
ncbi:MAG: PorP/SprF family type IX secretion system membrane protein [Bacteroidales bacterium]|jgi:type IX secretion system PorP/SprF family membrane protein|nr:PorP/SprF family type IX secretion system membrane protein [Bacteroidales bacterium]